MHLHFSGARALIALVAITGVTGTAATTASAKTAGKTKATRLHKAPARADLLARGLNLDLSDDGFDVTATIANVGKKFARSSDVVIAVSDDTTLDENDEVLEEYALPRLGAGTQRAFETDVEMPDDLPDGDLYLLVCADGNANVREKNETNNCVSESFDTADTNGLSSSTDDTSDGADDGSGDSADDDVADPTASVTLTDGQ